MNEIKKIRRSIKTALLTNCNSLSLVWTCIDVFGICFYYFEE